MEILTRTLAVVALAVVAHGCTSPSDSFWLTDQQLNTYRQRGGIEVSSPSGLYNGILEKVPTNAWKVVALQHAACTMDVPLDEVCDLPSHASLSLYVIHSRYPDCRYGAQVIVERKTKERYEEDHARAKRGQTERLKEGLMSEHDGVFWEWHYVKFHPTLEVDEDGTMYRRDIRCPNGDVLWIRGDVTKLTDRKTGQSLYPEMDTVMRRIINSIEPLNVTTNK